VTNIDPEHLDFWGDHDKIKEAFIQFCSRIPFYGLSVMCLDHPVVQSILPSLRRRYVTYGMSPQADYHARNVQSVGMDMRFDAYKHGEKMGRFSVSMPGEHNVLNCLAAIAVADELAVPVDVMQESLQHFDGVARRFTVLGEEDGVMIVDDYGHHPAEIRATLRAARQGFDRRIIVVFQPHRYTRTRDLFDEFTSSFNEADVVVVTDIYPAGEKPIEGISAETLAEALRKHGHQHVRLVPKTGDIPDFLEQLVEPGDLVISQGAGNINASVRELHRRLAARAESGADE
jgi:UDP-N-acetylmuramate--alanine ligase